MEKSAAGNILLDLSKEFAIEVIKICDEARSRGKAVAIINQLLRSGTSIGANAHEANFAASKADFINKLHISLKECYETEYWLDVFYKADILNTTEYNDLYNRCCKIKKMLIASIKTAKSRMNGAPDGA